MQFKYVVLFLGAALLGGCSNDQDSGTTSATGDNIPFTIVDGVGSCYKMASGGSFGMSDFVGEMVAHSQSEWSSTWQSRCDIGNALSKVDFNTLQVVGVSLGIRNNGCHTVSVQRVEQTSDKVRVNYAEKISSGMCTQALTNIAQLVTIPKSDLPVEFVNTTDKTNTQLNKVFYKTIAKSQCKNYGTADFVGNRLKGGVVARNRKEWEAAWAKCDWASVVPVVDFDKVQVVGVVLGDRPNGCYSMSLSIEQAKDRFIVHSLEDDGSGGLQLGADGKPSTQVCTTAFVALDEFVLIPKSTLPVEFTFDKVTY